MFSKHLEITDFVEYMVTQSMASGAGSADRQEGSTSCIDSQHAFRYAAVFCGVL